MDIFSPKQFLDYANNTDLIIGSYFRRGEDNYVIFRYSEKAKLLPPERWTPIMSYFEGLVIQKDKNGDIRVVIYPIKRIWEWNRQRVFPEILTVSKLWDGRCIYAKIITFNDKYNWFLSTVDSCDNKFTLKARYYMPKEEEILRGITFMFQFIDNENDYHYESEKVRGQPGLYLIRAWRSSSSTCLSYKEILSISLKMGQYIHPSEQRTMTGKQFQKLVNIYGTPKTRDNIRKGFVIQTNNGELYTFKFKVWLYFLEYPLVNEKNIKQFLSHISIEEKDRFKINLSFIIDQLKIKYFKYLTKSSKQYHHIIQNENLKMNNIIQLIIHKIKLIILKIEIDLPTRDFTKFEIQKLIEYGKCIQKIRIFLGIGFKKEIENRVSFMKNIQSSSEYYFLLLRALDT